LVSTKGLGSKEGVTGVVPFLFSFHPKPLPPFTGFTIPSRGGHMERISIPGRDDGSLFRMNPPPVRKALDARGVPATYPRVVGEDLCV